MTRKYAMVAINTKRQDDGIHIRRVLISYLFKTKKKIDGKVVTYYHGTKFIAADPYFSDKTASHKYTFTDRYYKLDTANNELSLMYALKSDIYKKRKYHSFGALTFEFKSESKQVAIHRFKVRKELK